MRQGGFWPAVAVHSTLTINLGRAVGKLKCDDDENEIDEECVRSSWKPMSSFAQ